MKAMILAAGKGTRLRPFTEHIPKCMVPLGGKPLLEYTVAWFHRYGVTELIINLYHLSEIVQNHFADGRRLGMRITYSLERQLLGTAGGVKNVGWFFDGPFIVWYGDNLSTCNLDRLVAFHQSKGGVATIALSHREDPTQSGIACLDEDSRIIHFVEKPRLDQVVSHWINAGIYVLEPSVLATIPTIGTPDFGHDIFPNLLTRGAALYGYRMSSDEKLWWIDTPDDLRRVEQGWTRMRDNIHHNSLR